MRLPRREVHSTHVPPQALLRGPLSALRIALFPLISSRALCWSQDHSVALPGDLPSEEAARPRGTRRFGEHLCSHRSGRGLRGALRPLPTGDKVTGRRSLGWGVWVECRRSRILQFAWKHRIPAAATCGGHISLPENWGVASCRPRRGSSQVSRAGGFAPGLAAKESHLRRPLESAELHPHLERAPPQFPPQSPSLAGLKWGARRCLSLG